MATKGIDCATPLTAKTAREIAEAGYRFVARYLVPEEFRWKRLTRTEAEAITDAGMQIISVYEAGANNPARGGEQGRIDGTRAYREAKLVQQPVGSAIYFAVDYDAGPGDYNAIEAYLRQATDEIPGYAVGVYGSYAVVEEMAKRLPGIKLWQTYAWSRGRKSAKANVYQWKNGQTLAGISVDYNESFGAEGWWNTNEQEEEQRMSAEDANKIIKFLSAAYAATNDPEARKEFNRLANELRKVSGQPMQ